VERLHIVRSGEIAFCRVLAADVDGASKLFAELFGPSVNGLSASFLRSLAQHRQRTLQAVS
jgi:hypothetical protein